jgi:hypothetical protein
MSRLRKDSEKLVKGSVCKEPQQLNYINLKNLVELSGLEPLTPSMPLRCATNCAIAPHTLLRALFIFSCGLWPVNYPSTDEGLASALGGIANFLRAKSKSAVKT